MLVIVWVVNLYGKMPSVSYCVDYDSVREDNQCELYYGLCICKGR